MYVKYLYRLLEMVFLSNGKIKVDPFNYYASASGMKADFNIFRLLISALIILFGLLATENLKACEELDQSTLFGDDVVRLLDYKYQGIASVSEKAFQELFAIHKLDFSLCRNALRVFVIKSKTSNIIYNALVTYEDDCDGGTTNGVILDQGMKKTIAIIHDSEISCLY